VPRIEPPNGSSRRESAPTLPQQQTEWTHVRCHEVYGKSDAVWGMQRERRTPIWPVPGCRSIPADSEIGAPGRISAGGEPATPVAQNCILLYRRVALGRASNRSMCWISGGSAECSSAPRQSKTLRAAGIPHEDPPIQIRRGMGSRSSSSLSRSSTTDARAFTQRCWHRNHTEARAVSARSTSPDQARLENPQPHFAIAPLRTRGRPRSGEVTVQGV
jgi:hypothetical protein